MNDSKGVLLGFGYEARLLLTVGLGLRALGSQSLALAFVPEESS